MSNVPDAFLMLLLAFMAAILLLNMAILIYVSSIKELMIRVWDELIRRSDEE